MTLSEFLLARIAEDEADARQAVDDYPEWRWDGEGLDQISATGSSTGFQLLSRRPLAGPHIARWDPARVLVECEAKRRIVKTYQRYEARLILGRGPQTTKMIAATLYMVLADLATVYADHSDYQQDWKP